MSFFDVILICIIVGFGFFGFWFGFVHTIGSLIGTVLGVYLATRWYYPLSGWIIHFTGWTGNFIKVIVFILVFVIINRIVGIIFFLIDKALSIFTRLPFIHAFDRFLGFAFGIGEGIIVIGVVLYFINKFPLTPAFMTDLAQSSVALLCVHVASLFLPLIPLALKQISDSVSNFGF